VDWLGQVAASGKISCAESLAAAMGCNPDIPDWGRQHLDELLQTQASKLGGIVARRANRALARYVAANYGRLADAAPKEMFATFYQRNKILTACGDDDAFQLLLNGYPSMSHQAQELADYAVVERGDPWVASFQKLAFRHPAPNGWKLGNLPHHQLSKALSHEIDDATAKAWIQSG